MIRYFSMRPSNYSNFQKGIAVVLAVIVFTIAISTFTICYAVNIEASSDENNNFENDTTFMVKSESTDEEHEDEDPLSNDILIMEEDYIKEQVFSALDDKDPLSGDSLIMEEDYIKEQAFSTLEDKDPLSDDILMLEDESSNNQTASIAETVDFEDKAPLSDDIYNISSGKIEKYAKYLELNVPYVLHTERDYSSLSHIAILIMTKVVYKEARFCPFEQQAAIAGLILNRLFAKEFPNDMFEMITAPLQFRESYAYAPFPEPDERTKAAIDCALDGIDFSCGAVGYYNPEYSTEAGIRYFETSTTMCAHIVAQMNLVLCCLNEHAEETLALPKYYY